MGLVTVIVPHIVAIMVTKMVAIFIAEIVVILVTKIVVVEVTKIEAIVISHTVTIVVVIIKSWFVKIVIGLAIKSHSCRFSIWLFVRPKVFIQEGVFIIEIVVVIIRRQILVSSSMFQFWRKCDIIVETFRFGIGSFLILVGRFRDWVLSKVFG